MYIRCTCNAGIYCDWCGAKLSHACLTIDNVQQNWRQHFCNDDCMTNRIIEMKKQDEIKDQTPSAASEI